MKAKLFQNQLIIKKSLIHGYGVFANKAIKKGEIVEECYALLTDGFDPSFDDFYFTIDEQRLMLLGFGSIYNHADTPNTSCVIDIERKIGTITALENIDEGEEIYIFYHEDWFNCRNLVKKIVPQWQKLLRRFLRKTMPIILRGGFIYICFGVIVYLAQRRFW
jgi:SET domain-containing protein